MSLMNQPVGFTYYTSNAETIPTSATAIGTLVTAGASDSDGTAVSLLSALAQDAHLVHVIIHQYNTAAADANVALDLLVDPAGGTSWSVLVNDLCAGFLAQISSTVSAPQSYWFPLWIPAGASIGARSKTSHTATINGRVLVSVYGGPRRPDQWWCGNSVETLGISDSRGTAITPGTSGSFGSWTNVGSTTAARYGALQLGLNGSDSNALTSLLSFQAGAGSSQLPGTGTMHRSMSASETGCVINNSPWWVDVPSASQLQVRGGTNDGATETLYVALYGVY